MIWVDTIGLDSEQLVPIDPRSLVADINTNGFPLLKGHDPGFPLGKVLTAEVFTSSDGAIDKGSLVLAHQTGAPLPYSIIA